jgi:hypothetical protein
MCIMTNHYILSPMKVMHGFCCCTQAFAAALRRRRSAQAASWAAAVAIARGSGSRGGISCGGGGGSRVRAHAIGGGLSLGYGLRSGLLTILRKNISIWCPTEGQENHGVAWPDFVRHNQCVAHCSEIKDIQSVKLWRASDFGSGHQAMTSRDLVRTRPDECVLQAIDCLLDWLGDSNHNGDQSNPKCQVFIFTVKLLGFYRWHPKFWKTKLPDPTCLLFMHACLISFLYTWNFWNPTYPTQKVG